MDARMCCRCDARIRSVCGVDAMVDQIEIRLEIIFKLYDKKRYRYIEIYQIFYIHNLKFTNKNMIFRFFPV